MEDINRIYDFFIENDFIEEQKLEELGIDAERIESLTTQNILQMVQPGLYNLPNAEGLYLYGRFLIREKKYAGLLPCMEKCYQIDPTHKKTNFQLFMKALNEENYENVFKHYSVFSATLNPFHTADNNFYLHLLKHITPLPLEYHNLVKNLQYKDIMIKANDNRFTDVTSSNQVRKYAFRGQLSKALHLQKDIGEKQSTDSITYRLIYLALQKKKEKILVLANYAKNKDYEAMYSILEREEDLGNLNEYDFQILKLVKEIMRIKKEGTLPTPSFSKSNSLFEALDKKDFRSAYKIYISENKAYSAETDLMKFLLEDILDLCWNDTSKKGNEKKYKVFSEPELEYELNVYLRNKIQEVIEKKEPIMLRKMDEKTRKLIYPYVKENIYLRPLEVGSDDDRRIVLIYNEPGLNSNEYITELIKNIKDTYAKKRFGTCVNLLLSFISITKYVKPYIYWKLAVCYSRGDYYNQDIDKAIMYLLMCIERTKKEQAPSEHPTKEELNNFIDELKKNEKAGTTPIVALNEFCDNTKDNQVAHLEEILLLVYEQDIPIESACLTYNLSIEQTNMVKLIIAKELYQSGYEKIANEIVKNVNQQRDKSEQVLLLLRSLLSQKKLLKSQESDTPLLLKSLPKITS